MPRSVPALVEDLVPDRTAFYLCDYWPALPSAFIQQLGAPPRRSLMTLPKRLVGYPLVSRLHRDTRPTLLFLHPICVSAAVRRLLCEAGVGAAHARVIHGGTQLEAFPGPAECRPRNDGELKLIYLGRLTPDKGVHTAIRALYSSALKDLHLTLDIYGTGDPDYEARLRSLRPNSFSCNRVRFGGSVLRSMVPALLQQHDALVFPSEWEEPFARTVLEAMAAGLPVIGTTTGGTGEILLDGCNGLTFKAGDEEELARKIALLARDPGLASRLGQAAKRTVRDGFAFERMVDAIEGALAAIVDNAPKKRPDRLEACGVE